MSLLSDYNARIVHLLLDEKQIPSFEDLVLEEMERVSPQKKEDLVRAVENRIKQILNTKHSDDSISHAVSDALSKLKKAGKVANIAHGIWKIQ